MTDLLKVYLLCGWMDRHRRIVVVQEDGLAKAACFRCGADLYKDLMSGKWKAKP